MYCAYNKDKFGNEITFCIPCWCQIKENSNYNLIPSVKDREFTQFLDLAEKNYFMLLNDGWKPEEARAVLPNATKTELIMTGFASDWKHFFGLRALGTTGKPHPSAQELAKPLYEEFIKRGYLNN